MTVWRVITLAAFVYVPMTIGFAAETPDTSPAARQEAERLDKMPAVTPHERGLDSSGRKEKGKASFYAKNLANRKMADGRRMDPNSNIAASKTLPLGSVAKVTNTENGKSANVKIEDRGPYVGGRVVDLSPKVAGELDVKHAGVAPVEVKPISIPQPQGGVKLGAGAAEVAPEEVRQAVETSKALSKPVH